MALSPSAHQFCGFHSYRKRDGFRASDMSRKNHGCSEAVVILSESAMCDTDICSLTGGGYLSETPKGVKSVKNIFCHFVFSAFFTFRRDSSSTPVGRSGIEGQQKAQEEKNKNGRERPHFFGFQPPKKLHGGRSRPSFSAARLDTKQISTAETPIRGSAVGGTCFVVTNLMS